MKASSFPSYGTPLEASKGTHHSNRQQVYPITLPYSYSPLLTGGALSPHLNSSAGGITFTLQLFASRIYLPWLSLLGTAPHNQQTLSFLRISLLSQLSFKSFCRGRAHYFLWVHQAHGWRLFTDFTQRRTTEQNLPTMIPLLGTAPHNQHTLLPSYKPSLAAKF
jgi:hypothetical protein